MKKYTWIIWLLYLLCSCSKNENKSLILDKTEIVDGYLMQVNNDSLALNQQLEYNNKARSMASLFSSDSLKVKYLFRVANRYYNLNDMESYREISEDIAEIAIQAQDSVFLPKAYIYLGDYYYKSNISDSALYFYLKAEKLYKHNNDFESLAETLISMARVKSLANDFVGAEFLISKSLSLLKITENKQDEYEAYTVLGYISNELKEYDKSLDAHNKALKLVEYNNLDNEQHQSAMSLNNIGNVYQNKNNHIAAIKFFNKAITEKYLYKDRPDLYALILDNIAYSRVHLRQFKDLNLLFYKALRIRDSLGLTSYVVLSKIRISEYLAIMNDSSQALQMAYEAHKDAIKSAKSLDMLLALKQLIKVDPMNASAHSQYYINLNDSIQRKERKANDKFARIQYETGEIEQANTELQTKNRNLFLFFIGTTMIGLLLFVIRTQRAKNRELLMKQAQQKANEDIYNLMLAQQNNIEAGRIKEKKRIAQELHDGVLGRLFGARMNLDSLNRAEGDEARVKSTNYLNELKNIEQDIREISHDLNREKTVLINNFVAILTNLLEEQSANFKPEVEVDFDDSIKWDTISNNLKINIYRIFQEALQNINKYAQASHIKVSLELADNQIRLDVVDDGLGFDSDKKSRGIGLQNMVSRTNECDGVFDIKSKKGKGTAITVLFPILPTVSQDTISKPTPILA